MKAPICCIIAHSTASVAMSFAGAPAFGHGEVADNPIAVPKVRSTKEIAAARKAPASTAPHSTKLAPAAELAPAPGAGPTCVIDNASTLAKPECTQDEHHHHDQADDVDNVVHG